MLSHAVRTFLHIPSFDNALWGYGYALFICGVILSLILRFANKIGFFACNACPIFHKIIRKREKEVEVGRDL